MLVNQFRTKEGTDHEQHEDSRRLHPRPLAARHARGSPGSSCSREAGYDADRARLAGRRRHRRGRRGPTRTRIADHGIDDVTDALRGDHRRPAGQADPDRPLLRRHDRREAARRGPRRGGDRHRRRADQGRAAAAAVGAARDAAGVQEPGQQAPGGLADRRAVPLQLRQRASPRRSPTSCSSGGRSPRRASRCSRPRRRTSRRTRRPRSTPTTRTAGRCCSIMGGKDHTVPEAITKSTLKQYRHSPR